MRHIHVHFDISIFSVVDEFACRLKSSYTNLEVVYSRHDLLLIDVCKTMTFLVHISSHSDKDMLKCLS